MNINLEPSDNVGNRLNLNGGRDAINNLRCVPTPIGCGRQLSEAEIRSWDPLSQKEYTQSGWCLQCQDKIFKEPEDDVIECTHPGMTCEDWWGAETVTPDTDCICTCNNPRCEADIGVGIINCGSQHCRVHGEEAK